MKFDINSKWVTHLKTRYRFVITCLCEDGKRVWFSIVKSDYYKRWDGEYLGHCYKTINTRVN